MMTLLNTQEGLLKILCSGRKLSTRFPSPPLYSKEILVTRKPTFCSVSSAILLCSDNMPTKWNKNQTSPSLSELAQRWWWEVFLLRLFLTVAHVTFYLISRLSPWLFVSRWKSLARISLYPRVVFHSSKSRSVWLWHSSNAGQRQTLSSFFGPTLSSSFADEGSNSMANCFLRVLPQFSTLPSDCWATCCCFPARPQGLGL